MEWSSEASDKPCPGFAGHSTVASKLPLKPCLKTTFETISRNIVFKLRLNAGDGLIKYPHPQETLDQKEDSNFCELAAFTVQQGGEVVSGYHKIETGICHRELQTTHAPYNQLGYALILAYLPSLVTPNTVSP